MLGGVICVPKVLSVNHITEVWAAPALTVLFNVVKSNVAWLPPSSHITIVSVITIGNVWTVKFTFILTIGQVPCVTWTLITSPSLIVVFNSVPFKGVQL